MLFNLLTRISLNSAFMWLMHAKVRSKERRRGRKSCSSNTHSRYLFVFGARDARAQQPQSRNSHTKPQNHNNNHHLAAAQLLAEPRGARTFALLYPIAYCPLDYVPSTIRMDGWTCFVFGHSQSPVECRSTRTIFKWLMKHLPFIFYDGGSSFTEHRSCESWALGSRCPFNRIKWPNVGRDKSAKNHLNNSCGVVNSLANSYVCGSINVVAPKR